MVCSFLEVETTMVIKDFLKKNNKFTLSPFTKSKNSNLNKFINNSGVLLTIPNKYKNFNIDGFFAAKIIKND